MMGSLANRILEFIKDNPNRDLTSRDIANGIGRSDINNIASTIFSLMNYYPNIKKIKLHPNTWRFEKWK